MMDKPNDKQSRYFGREAWVARFMDGLRRTEQSADPFLEVAAYEVTNGTDGAPEPQSGAQLFLALIDAADHDDPPRPLGPDVPGLPPNVPDEAERRDPATQETHDFICPGCLLRAYGRVQGNGQINSANAIVRWCNKPACQRLRFHMNAEERPDAPDLPVIMLDNGS